MRDVTVVRSDSDASANPKIAHRGKRKRFFAKMGSIWHRSSLLKEGNMAVPVNSAATVTPNLSLGHTIPFATQVLGAVVGAPGNLTPVTPNSAVGSASVGTPVIGLATTTGAPITCNRTTRTPPAITGVHVPSQPLINPASAPVTGNPSVIIATASSSRWDCVLFEFC